MCPHVLLRNYPAQSMVHSDCVCCACCDARWALPVYVGHVDLLLSQHIHLQSHPLWQHLHHHHCEHSLFGGLCMPVLHFDEHGDCCGLHGMRKHIRP